MMRSRPPSGALTRTRPASQTGATGAMRCATACPARAPSASAWLGQTGSTCAAAPPPSQPSGDYRPKRHCQMHLGIILTITSPLRWRFPLLRIVLPWQAVPAELLHAMA